MVPNINQDITDGDIEYYLNIQNNVPEYLIYMFLEDIFELKHSVYINKDDQQTLNPDIISSNDDLEEYWKNLGILKNRINNISLEILKRTLVDKYDYWDLTKFHHPTVTNGIKHNIELEKDIIVNLNKEE
jgi:hypothetical protein